MQVVVPAGVKGGDALQVTTPDGSSVLTTVPAGLTEGEVFLFDVTPVIQPVMAIPVSNIAPPVDRELVRKCGAVPLESARAYAARIPPEQRSVTGCYKVKCAGGACMGCSYNVACGGPQGCLWTPNCLLFNPLVHIFWVYCFCSNESGGYASNKNDMHLYEVDSDAHTLACYSIPCGQCHQASGNETPWLYCEKW